MSPRGKARLQLLRQRGDDPRHPLDRIGAFPGQSAVGSASADDDLDPGRPLLPYRYPVHRLLADDNSVRTEFGRGDEMEGAGSRGLLIGDRGDHQPAAQRHPGARQRNGAHDLGSDAGLVVSRTAPINPTIGDLRREWWIRPDRLVAGRHHIEMGIEAERWALRDAPLRDDVWFSRFVREGPYGKAGLSERALADRGRLGDVAWGIHRRRTHEVAQEGNRLVGIDHGQHRTCVVLADSDRERFVHAARSLRGGMTSGSVPRGQYTDVLMAIFRDGSGSWDG